MGTLIIVGDCRERLSELPAESVHCVVTSPPYFGLRDYGVAGQIGLEATPDAFVAEMVAVFRGVRRVLRQDGTLWLNLGDSYAATTKGSSGVGKNATNKGTLLADRSWAVPPGLKPKDLIGIPWRVAFALQADGWWLRQDIIWSKPNPMPESVTDRCTKAHEYLFLLTKSERYHFDAEVIAEPSLQPLGMKEASSGRGSQHKQKAIGQQLGRSSTLGANQGPETRNKRSVWTVATQPFAEAHFATFPPALIEPCILAGSPAGGTVLDPFFGAGTTGLVADRLGRSCIGIELNPAYAEMARERIQSEAPMFSRVEMLATTGANDG